MAIALLFNLSSNATAQSSQQPIPDVYHSSWLTKDGAPRGITSLAQTRDGYLWIGTNLGLYQFDGTRFTEFPDFDGAPKLPSATIKSIAADDENGVWVGYDHHGISHISNGHIRNIALPASFGDSAVEHIYCCAKSSLWALAADTILRWKDGHWEDLATLQGLPRRGYLSLFFDHDKNVWATTATGIYEWRDGEQRFLLKSKSGNATQLAQLKDGTIWANDRMGNIHPLDSGCDPTREGIGVLSRSTFVPDDVGRLWVGSEKHGILRIPNPGGSCPSYRDSFSFTTANGLTSNAVRALLIDHFGDIWIGTSMGIDRFRPRFFTAVGDQDFESYPAIAGAPNGSVWIQKLGRKLVHVSDKGSHEFGPSRFLCPMVADAQSGVWLFDTSEQQLLHYNSADILDKTIAVEPGMLGMAATAIAWSADGTVFVTFAHNGLWSYTDRWHRVDHPEFKTPTSLLQDGDTTWAGYVDNLLVSFLKGGKQTYSSNDGLDVGTPLVIARRGNVLWTGGTEGVNFLIGRRFHRLMVRAPEKLRGVSGLVFDGNGDLWLNTGFGAIQIKSKEIESALKDYQHPVITEVYGSADGVIGLPTQTWPTPSLIRDGNGFLWFATAGNLVRVDPNVLAGLRSQPVVDLQTIRINGKRIAASEFDKHPVRLEGGRMNRIEFQYTAIDLDHPNHIVFRYWLRGEDKGWQEAGNSHMAMYSRLRPGHYEFLVAATKGDAAWVELASPFKFDIQPAFYQTTWFLVVCWILGAVCLWLLYLARVRSISGRLRERLEERSNERLRIARNLHDTLLQSIHGLMLTFHYAADELGTDSPAVPALQEALKRADSLILEGRNSLQELRGEADREKSLTQLLAETAREEVATNSASIKIVEEGVPYPVRPLVQEEFCRIGTEAIRNALHHAKASSIHVEVSYGRRFFRLVCRDDGLGIPDDVMQASGKRGHWGLRGMQERARLIGAKFSLWTAAGDGTEIDVRLRSTLAYDHVTRFDRILAAFGIRRR